MTPPVALTLALPVTLLVALTLALTLVLTMSLTLALTVTLPVALTVTLPLVLTLALTVTLPVALTLALILSRRREQERQFRRTRTTPPEAIRYDSRVETSLRSGLYVPFTLTTIYLLISHS